MNFNFSQFKFSFKKRYIILAFIVVFIIFSIVRGQQKKKDAQEFFTVVQDSLTEEIILSGDIDMGNRVDLGFGMSGRVSEIFVKEGDIVQAGDVLARVSMSSLQAELLEAEANLKQSQADSGATTVNLAFAYQNLQNTIAEQNTLVDNAYKALLNESLESYTEKETTAVPPVISGTYTGIEEGEYIINPYNSSSKSGFSFNLTGLENGNGTVKTNIPGPLGTQGLFIQFSEDSNYSWTEWTVSIPNKRSANYTTRKNAYDQALATRNKTISQAEDVYLQAQALDKSSGTISKSDASIMAARARIDGVLARMNDGVIKAPFDGVVGILNLSVGEIVSANTPYITLVGSEDFELNLNVPEIDVSKISFGDEVHITLDAYGENMMWNGLITSINVIDTLVDGVSVYKTKVSVLNPDENMRVGMSAKARIVTREKDSVLVAPLYFFTRDVDGYTAQIFQDSKIEKVPVQLGIIGSNGFVEIIDGVEQDAVLVRTRDSQ